MTLGPITARTQVMAMEDRLRNIEYRVVCMEDRVKAMEDRVPVALGPTEDRETPTRLPSLWPALPMATTRRSRNRGIKKRRR